MGSDWGKKYKEMYPFRYWIDSKFSDKGLCGYAPHYTLSHPWKILEYWRDEIKYAWQRVFRGWDDRIIWSIDSYLAEMIPVWVTVLKESKWGVPIIMFTDDEMKDPNGISNEADARAEKEYDIILDKIIDGFSSYDKLQQYCFEIDSPEETLAKQKFEQGFDLFKEYFSTLWD